MNDSRRFKDAIYDQLARIGQAVASARRLELLDLLAQGPRTVESLARETGQSMANTSQHLRVLRVARLVAAEKRGLYVTYRLSDLAVAQFVRSLRILAESRVSDIEAIARDFLQACGVLEPVDQESLIARVARGDVTVIDVRPVEEYRAGHIPGALSFPLAQLERRMGDLSKRKEVVAYCRGPYCVLAIDAVVRLRAAGYRAVRLEAGIPDWRARGFPVTTGDQAIARRVRGVVRR